MKKNQHTSGGRAGRRPAARTQRITMVTAIRGLRRAGRQAPSEREAADWRIIPHSRWLQLTTASPTPTNPPQRLQPLQTGDVASSLFLPSRFPLRKNGWRWKTRGTERRELAELVSLADFDVPPLATAPQQTKKRANLKHVNNMCLTQTAKPNSLLTLPQLFPPSLIY